MRPQSGSSRILQRRIILSVTSFALVLFVVVGIVVVNGATAGKQTKVTPPATTTPTPARLASSTPTAQASPLLFGTNLGL
ncbi:MAG TPA: hypothetical protein VIY29_00400, partial [Ktedonobacteraceae bacterium]